MAHLLLIDTTQIQDYIFKSNRLRENIGASYLAAQATGPWIIDSLAHVTAAHNVLDPAALTLDPARRFEDNLDAEIIYIGGGNSLIIFRRQAHITAFIRRYSRCLLLHAPGLNIITAALEFDWQDTDRNKTLHQHVARLFDQVAARAKRERLPSNPLLGLAVTAACRSTGLPAVAMAPIVQDDPDSVYPVSSEIHKKLLAASPTAGNPTSLADAHLRRLLNLNLDQRYLFPSDFDHLGRTAGEQSYIAVVHADGDGIGRHIQHIGANPRLDNRAYITARRAFSDNIRSVMTAALRDTFQPLLRQLSQDSAARDTLIHLNDFGDELGRITLAPSDSEPAFYLPFRPLVFAGDDLTFVCDGRISLSLTTSFLTHFQHHCRTIFAQDFTASAGAAIVKAHYPFARAYTLAGELTAAAKQYRRDNNIQGGCLDWYFTAGGLHAPLLDMRAREYTGPDGSLTLRPIALQEQPVTAHNRRTWPTVFNGVCAFQDVNVPAAQSAPLWSSRRSKAKALRDALRQGRTPTQFFMTAAGIDRLPPVAGPNDFRTDGYQQQLCGYFDALELADLYMPIRRPPPDQEDNSL